MTQFRCAQRDESNRQCVLMREHAGKVPCLFEVSKRKKEVAAGFEPKPKMNKTETRYANILEGRQLAGEIKNFEFEAIKLRLADGVRYTPDFFVEMPDGKVECHETKGGWIYEDARVKLRVAATRFQCFKFILAQYKKGQWEISEVRV